MRFGPLTTKSYIQETTERPKYSTNTPHGIANLWETSIRPAAPYEPGREFAWMILMTSKFEVMGWSLVSAGTISSAHIAMREVFRPILCAGAGAAIFIHNHPSGNPTPSANDWLIWKGIQLFGTFFDTEIPDSLIVTDPDSPFISPGMEFYSMRFKKYSGEFKPL